MQNDEFNKFINYLSSKTFNKRTVLENLTAVDVTDAQQNGCHCDWQPFAALLQPGKE